MKHLITLLLILFVCLVACKDEAGETVVTTTQVEDSVITDNIDTVLSGETIALLNQSGFSTFAKSKASAFNWNSFRMISTWKEDSLYVTPFEPVATYYASYKPFLKFSPDSTKFIDLDSYNLSIQKDNSGRSIGIENGPDTEVSLVSVKDKRKTRLVYLGPGSSIEDGSWIDNDNLILLGFQESTNTGVSVPVIWRYNLLTSTYYIYEMPDANIAKQLMGQWRRERLKSIILK